MNDEEGDLRGVVLALEAKAGSAAYAVPPVREQNLDDDGLIRVHEQGVADVNVTNDPLNLSVANEAPNVSGEAEVSNVPARTRATTASST